jgi:hypothetical protein
VDRIHYPMYRQGQMRLNRAERSLGNAIMSLLYSKSTLGPLALQNHLVMSPMTRNRAIGNIPNELMAEYYA